MTLADHIAAGADLLPVDKLGPYIVYRDDHGRPRPLVGDFALVAVSTRCTSVHHEPGADKPRSWRCQRDWRTCHGTHHHDTGHRRWKDPDD